MNDYVMMTPTVRGAFGASAMLISASAATAALIVASE